MTSRTNPTHTISTSSFSQLENQDPERARDKILAEAFQAFDLSFLGATTTTTSTSVSSQETDQKSNAEDLDPELAKILDEAYADYKDVNNYEPVDPALLPQETAFQVPSRDTSSDKISQDFRAKQWQETCQQLMTFLKPAIKQSLEEAFKMYANDPNAMRQLIKGGFPEIAEMATHFPGSQQTEKGPTELILPLLNPIPNGTGEYTHFKFTNNLGIEERLSYISQALQNPESQDVFIENFVQQGKAQYLTTAEATIPSKTEKAPRQVTLEEIQVRKKIIEDLPFSPEEQDAIVRNENFPLELQVSWFDFFSRNEQLAIQQLDLMCKSYCFSSNPLQINHLAISKQSLSEEEFAKFKQETADFLRKHLLG